MTNEERIKIFIDEIKSESSKKINKISKQGEQKIKNLVNKGKVSINNEADLYYKSKCNAIINENTIDKVNQTNKYKQEIISKRNELTEEFFNQIKSEIINFVNSDKYADYIKKFVENLKNITAFYVRSNDIDLFKKLTKAEVLEDNSVILGGFKAKTEDNKFIDNTFDRKLQTEIENFPLNSGLSID